MRGRRIAAAWLLASALCASSAGAGPPSEEAKARALEKYEQGSAAFQRRRYKDAVDLFLEADAIAQSPAFAYNIGLAYREMGDDANALRWLREYMRRAPRADDRKFVASYVNKLERRLMAKGVQQLTVMSEPAGATLVIDGEPKGVTPWTGELPPGAHHVALQLRGYEDAERDLELAAEHAGELAITLRPAPLPPSLPPSAPSTSAPLADSPPPEPEGSTHPMVVLGSVAIGLGAAGFGAAIGLEVARASAEQSARDAATQIEAAREVDRMEDLRDGARAALGVGVGVTAVGAVVLGIGLADSAERGVAMGCDGHGCGFSWRGSF